MPGLLELAVEQLHDNLLTDFGADGVHRERSTHYHMIALRSFVGARENCRRFDVALPASFDERLSRACDFALPHAPPRRHDPRALATATPATTRELLELAARLLARDDLRRTPAGHASFADGGYFVQRAGERYLIFDCGPLGDGGHGHYDALSIEAWAGERAAGAGPRPLHLRRGRAEPAPLVPRHRRPQHGHRRRPRPDAVRALALLAAERRGDVPRPRRSATASTSCAARSARPVYEAVHRRRVIFVDGAYWLIEDVLHRRARATATTCASTSRRATPTLSRCTIKGARSVALEDGWISPASTASRHAAPVVSAVAVGDARALRHAARAATTRVLELDGDIAARRRRHDRARRAGDAAMIADPAVPRRDALLRPETMAGVISQRLHDGVPVERCERTYVKYRVGESLRVVYRYDGDATSRRAPASATASPRPRSAPRSTPSPTTASSAPAAPVGPSACSTQPVTPRLVAWAAEQSATFECRDARGTRDRLRQGADADAEYRAAARSRTRVRVPRVLAARATASSSSKRSSAAASTARPSDGLHALGAALAALHANAQGVRPRRSAVRRGSTRASSRTAARRDRDARGRDVARRRAAAARALLERPRRRRRERRCSTATRTCATRSSSPAGASRCSTSST